MVLDAGFTNEIFFNWEAGEMSISSETKLDACVLQRRPCVEGFSQISWINQTKAVFERAFCGYLAGRLARVQQEVQL